MENINKFNSSNEVETSNIKTDISHIYSKLNSLSGDGSGNNGGSGEFLRKEKIEELANSLRFYTYKQLTEQKFTLVEALRYKAKNGFIQLPPMMYFHYVTSDETRAVSYVNHYKVTALLSAEEAETENVNFTVLTNNDETNLQYKNFTFEISSNGTICEFEYEFTNTKFQQANKACPFIISVQSESRKKIVCHIVKLSVPFNEEGNFADKSNYLCHAIYQDNPLKSATKEDYPLGLPLGSAMFIASDTVGYVKNIKVKDFIAITKLTLVDGIDIFDNETSTGNYDVLHNFSIPLTNAKDISFGKPGNFKTNATCLTARCISFFYLSREGHVFYKIYDTIDNKVYEGQFCDGVYDGIVYFGDAAVPTGSREECFLYLKPLYNKTKMDKEENEIIVYNFDNNFYKSLEKKINKFVVKLNDLGLENFIPCYIDMIFCKEEHSGFFLEAFNSNFERKNVAVRLIYDSTSNSYNYATNELTGRCQKPGNGYSSNRYIGSEIEGNDWYYYTCTATKLMPLENRRNEVLRVPLKPGLTPVMQPLYRNFEFVCELDETTFKPCFKACSRSDMPSTT